jgi:hypothetical protein
MEIVQNGKITEGELYADVMRYRVEGISDGRRLACVVSFSVEERLIVIVTELGKVKETTSSIVALGVNPWIRARNVGKENWICSPFRVTNSKKSAWAV